MQVLSPVCGPPSAPLACSCRQQFAVSATYRSASEPCRHLRGVHGHCACPVGAMCSGSDGGLAPRQTASHLYEEGEKIGKGGSCDVYCGVEKGTGKRHALKVLSHPSPAQYVQLFQEAELLSKLSNPKVVKFYGQSVELQTGRPVVVLEYCSGGSLLSFLQQPENAKGLVDDEFRSLLSDLVDGLSYLRGKGIVHRDIKPGNILRHVHPTGKCEYKLSDFGTSREATDTEQMTSIVGTEEYLHPVLYKNAFFGNATQSALNPTSGELWSLGCTLYHAMTALIPFRPLGGPRNNRKAMLVMISQKPPGTISGEQKEDGTFRWSKTPPNDCRMSESLREKIVPLLQNLMETNVQQQWNFGTFLDESQRILGMRSFDVCDTECGHLFRLYLEPKQSLAELQDALAYHTEMPACQQLLFHRVQPLHTMLTSRALVKDLPLTQTDQPLLLLSGQSTEGRCRRHVPVQPQLLPNETTLEEDIASAFKVCSDLHLLSLMALTLYNLPNILFTAILALRSALTSALSTVETRFRVLSATCQERQSRLHMLTEILETVRPVSCDGQHSKLDQARQLCDQLRENLWQLKYRLDELRKSAEGVRHDNLMSDASCRDDNSDALSHIFTSAKEIWRRMQERREKIPLPQFEQEKHKGDKASLNRLSMQSSSRIRHMQTKRTTLLEQYTTQVRQLYTRLKESQDIEARLLQMKEESEQFSSLLNEIWTSGSEDLRKMAELANRSTVPRSSTPLHNQLGALLSEDLPTLETFTLGSPDPSQK